MTDEQLELPVDVLCLWCDRPAAFECDAPIGRRRGIPPTSLEVYGCDAPMCAHHRRRIGHIRFSGRRDGSRGDSIDHCPYHARPGIPADIDRNMTAESAAAYRAELRRHVALDRSIGLKEVERDA